MRACVSETSNVYFITNIYNSVLHVIRVHKRMYTIDQFFFLFISFFYFTSVYKLSLHRVYCPSFSICDFQHTFIAISLHHMPEQRCCVMFFFLSPSKIQCTANVYIKTDSVLYGFSMYISFERPQLIYFISLKWAEFFVCYLVSYFIFQSLLLNEWNGSWVFHAIRLIVR